MIKVDNTLLLIFILAVISCCKPVSDPVGMPDQEEQDGMSSSAEMFDAPALMQTDVIPRPSSVEISGGVFLIAGAEIKSDPALGDAAADAVAEFEKAVSAASGVQPESGSRLVEFRKDVSMAEEEYSISVSGNGSVIKSSGLNGVLYAIETLKQMLPVGVYTGTYVQSADWLLPCMEIRDTPRFSYRGLCLDVSRHFFDVSQVKECICMMRLHKLNKLHLHLTDDQGWRMEIKKYPQLTEIGAVRSETLIGRWSDNNRFDGIPYGEGLWYSQDDIREIVAYAAANGIEVIPEIDLPSHMLAALATFPELGCTGGPYEVCHWWGVQSDVLCVGRESTFEFLENVLSEICDLFPSRYVHIGGDECPKVRWETCPHCQAKIAELGLHDEGKYTAEHYLQSYVTRRIEIFLASKGKSIIGWDEILEGDIEPSATIMSWRGTAGGLSAAGAGHDVIMTPTTHCYFNYYQSPDYEAEPFARDLYLPVDMVYSFEPYAEDMTDEHKSHILGVQACVWTEYIKDWDGVEYMLLPRLSALSEVQWCAPENKDYDAFLRKMYHMSEIYDALGYNYGKHIFEKF